MVGAVAAGPGGRRAVVAAVSGWGRNQYGQLGEGSAEHSRVPVWRGCRWGWRSGAEWVPFDTTVLFARPPTSDAERDAWTKKPRVPRRTRALTARPIVRYLGRDATDSTVEGWRPWVDQVTAWLTEGRSPTVFLHTSDNADAPMLARRFHDAVRARLPGLEPLPDPLPAEPLTLFSPAALC
jgi:uncharacterized protein DUF72/regulator of chromosome condensation (RCC1) repeat-containing protein